LLALELAATVVHAAGAVAGHRVSRVALAIDLAALVALGGHAVAGLASVRAPVARYRALLAAPEQVGWKVRLWAQTLRSDEDVTWTRTRRNVERSG
jgi:hypothetical protein